MGFVADDQVEFGRGSEQGLEILRPAQHIHARNPAWALSKWISGPGRVDQITCEYVEAEAKLLAQLVLPLLDEASRRDNQTALKISADHQLLD